MWENRCKVAVSGVGFSKVSRTADIPLAAHALTAVKEAVADSGLQMSDIDGLATYPELPATGHAEVDGISIVSVNGMMAMLKLPNLTWHIQVGTTNIGGAVQQAVNALIAGPRSLSSSGMRCLPRAISGSSPASFYLRFSGAARPNLQIAFSAQMKDVLSHERAPACPPGTPHPV